MNLLSKCIAQRNELKELTQLRRELKIFYAKDMLTLEGYTKAKSTITQMIELLGKRFCDNLVAYLEESGGK